MTVPGRLYLVPCTISPETETAVLPMANMEPISRIRYWVVEDLKTARRFLRKMDREYPIDDCRFFSMGKHASEDEMMDALMILLSGETVGMLSEAGCPAVADPGHVLVAMAQQNHISVTPLVGPNSIILTLMSSGLQGQRFAFLGYPPHLGEERKEFFGEMMRRVHKGETQLVMDAPFRNHKLFDDILKHASAEWRLCLAQDVTGKQEHIVTKTVAQWKKKKPAFQKIPMMLALGQ